jgi:prevent-host-death family protein
MVINMHEAKSRLSELVELARQGQRVIIARSGVPVADLVPHREAPQLRAGGQWRGRARVAPDFDAPMPDVEDLFGA